MPERLSATHQHQEKRREPETTATTATASAPVPLGLRPVAGLAVRRLAEAPQEQERLGSRLGGMIRRVLTGAAVAPAAQAISNGHALGKHQAEFAPAEAGDQAKFDTHVQHVMTNATDSKDLSGGRSAYWDDTSKTVVIHNPKAGDQGTCFKPKLGKLYYDNLT